MAPSSVAARAEGAEEAARLARAVLGLRERGAQRRRDAPQQEHEAPAGAPYESPASAFWRARRAHLRRIAAVVGQRTLDGGAEEVRRASGSPDVHRVRHRATVCGPRLPPPAAAGEAVLGCLELVAGVGPVAARRLRAAGCASVRDLLQIGAYRQEAAAIVGEWERGDLRATCARLTRRLGGRGHLLSALLCSSVALEEVAFLDLETMGLWNNTVFLAGVGRIEDGRLHVHQYLAPGHADEPAVVGSALAHLADARVVVTFNGRSADLPWLAGRAFYYGLGPLPTPAHVDLLYGTRRRYQRDEERLERVRLPDVSGELLRLERPATDVPSWMVPEVYDHYTRAPADREGMLLPILEHNRADLEALVHLLELLCREAAAAVPTG